MRNVRDRAQKAAAVVITAVMVLSLVPALSMASQVTPIPTLLQNGSFEENPHDLPGTGAMSPGQGRWWQQYLSSAVPGWETTASDSKIEIWITGFRPPQPGTTTFLPSDGTYLAEINATVPAMLYQDLATTNGALYEWSVDHRGRMSSTIGDQADLELGNPAGMDPISITPAMVAAQMETTNVAWQNYSGYYTANSATTRFGLMAVASVDPGGTLQTDAANLAVGNMVDNAKWTPIASPSATPAVIWQDQDLPTSDDLAVINMSAYSTDTTAHPPVTVDPTKQSDYDNKVPGVYEVKVPIVNGNGIVVGYVTTTVTIKAIYTVTANYVDEDGNVLLAPDTATVRAGDPYVPPTPPAEIVGKDGKVYVYVPGKDTGDTTATDPITGDKSITFTYQLKPQTLTVKFVDKDGNVLKTTVTDKKNGDPYSVPEPGQTVTINGKTYRYVEVKAGSDALTGTMDGDKTVIFVLELVPGAPVKPAKPSTPGALPLTGDLTTLAPIAELTLVAGTIALTAIRRRRLTQ